MEKTKFSRFQKFIKLIESLCNKIPQPGILFMYLFVITAVLKLGTLISNMIPIGIVISVVWIVFLIVWMVAGLPIGPAVPIFMSAK